MNSLFEPLRRFLNERAGELSEIPVERKEKLFQFSKSIRELRSDRNFTEIVFVCTHNSRRSQIAQMLILACAEYKGISGIRSFSGGTEVTAFHPNSVQALSNIGFEIDTDRVADGNPKYRVSYGENLLPVTGFSKLYSDEANPHERFIAVMVCSSADRACPMVPGAVRRVSLPYSDPKAFDDSPEAINEYIETCKTIARELLFVMDPFENVAGDFNGK
ncbi:hypothetical protein [Leptospira wolffii]|uniref:hypothetical protein n=1 Tax=Leptospira wolffii TaxID=409998 RepID=UPI0002E8A06A|nr:hypothetical protein [Leptospira wolffii]EPG66374.1 low molecular weight phosphotyrosine protein phosphatase domain protein [Leptospira wolffii serovar Khorat str. Khorat-H2]